jgi:hypothetical protein
MITGHAEWPPGIGGRVCSVFDGELLVAQSGLGLACRDVSRGRWWRAGVVADGVGSRKLVLVDDEVTDRPSGTSKLPAPRPRYNGEGSCWPRFWSRQTRPSSSCAALAHDT